MEYLRGLAGDRLRYDVANIHFETSGDFDRYRITARPLETFYRNGGKSRRFGAEHAVAQDGYTLVNARAAWQVRVGGSRAELLVQVRNLTGEKYIAFTEPDPDGNFYQPGPERELFAGVRLSLR